MKRGYIKSFNKFKINENTGSSVDKFDEKDALEKSYSVKRFNDFVIYVEELKKTEKPFIIPALGNGSSSGRKIA